MAVKIEIAAEKIGSFCRKWQLRELALFGSVLRDDFGPNSDVDVLVRYAPNRKPSLLELSAMKTELAEVFGRPVDLVDRDTVEQSRNYIRRRHILQSAEVLHGS